MRTKCLSLLALLFVVCLVSCAQQSSAPAPLVVTELGKATLPLDGPWQFRLTGELYGFDRLEQLLDTCPDAKQATDAAVAFGQEDDITVLTITRLATGVESTTLLEAPTLVASTA